MTNDHLGSPRINTDRDGNVTARHDYHPFGEEISTSQRTAGLGYADDTVRKQFTGYERDGETELDFAQARFFSSSLGRFMASDPYNVIFEKKPAKYASYIILPQNWNHYAYTINNPTNYVDPDGENWFKVKGEWIWSEGDTYTYKDKKGRERTMTSNYTHLITIEKTGETTAQGGEKVIVTLYGNKGGKVIDNNIIAQGDGFSGSSTKISTQNGDYEVNLNNRGGPNTNVDLEGGLGLRRFHDGIQEISSEIPSCPTFGGAPCQYQGDWGTRRAHLTPLEGQDDNFYLHGKKKFVTEGRTQTAGCTAEPEEIVLQAVFGL